MENNQFKCERCYRIFKLQHHLKNHLKKKFFCKKKEESKRIQANPNESSNSSSSKYGLNKEKHNQIIHECNFCKKQFSTNSNLNKHMKRSCKNAIESKRIQLNPKKSILLTNTTSEISGLNEEKQDQENHECDYCKKHFSTNSNLHKHMKRSCKKKAEAENYIKLKKMFSKKAKKN